MAKWWKEFFPSLAETYKEAVQTNWPEFKKELGLGAKAVGQGTKSVIEGIAKPIFSAVRNVLTPTVIWLVVVIIVGLLLYGWFRKVAKI